MRKTYPEVSAQLLINHKVNVMVGGLQSINMYNNLAVEFEAVTGCSLSHGQDMGCPSVGEEGSSPVRPQLLAISYHSY